VDDHADWDDPDARRQRIAEIAADPRQVRQRLAEIQAHIEGRWEPWSPYRATPPPGRQWLCDVPGRDGMRVYIVRRRFTHDGGTVANRDEIILPDLGFWEERPLRMILFNDGYLEPLDVKTLAWQCPHGRFWATREAIEAHGCCELPVEVADSALAPTGREASISEQWCKGLTAAQIGEIHGLSTKRVSNLIGDCRKRFGLTYFPHRETGPGR
jgi:hypothetical protein